MLDFMQYKKPIRELELTAEALLEWTKTDFGQYILRSEDSRIRERYSKFPGFRCMHLGLSENLDLLTSTNQIHSFTIQSNINTCTEKGSLVSNLSDLPLPAEVIDVAFLQHTLEFSCSPQAVLAEACRVLAPGGNIILCVFNPIGPAGLANLPMRIFTRRPQYQFHHLRVGRITDWLSLLNFQVVEISYGAFVGPPNDISSAAISNGISEKSVFHQAWENFCIKCHLPIGNFYMIHAVKRISRGIGNMPAGWRIPSRSNLGSPIPPVGSKRVEK
jgi:SAM-dependent methyltransferase